jgi:threonine dehydratase
MVDDVYKLTQDALELIKSAQRRRIIYRTPLVKSDTISGAAGGQVFLKLEALQKTGSFKARGAYNAITRMSREGVKHVVTASAGNHAQGVAYVASLYGMKATIVMPVMTPWIKISRTRKYGADVILHGESYAEAEAKAMELAKELKATYVHAYNDPYIVAGQGTIGWEILEDLDEIDAVVVPIGGGGLISGIATVIKKKKPSVKVIGVQSEGAPSAYLSLKEGKIMGVASVDTIAEGIAVKRIGDLTFNLMREVVDDVVLVSDNDIVNAILVIGEATKVIAEGAGAAAVAALLSGKVNIKGNVVAVVSGGNIDMPMLTKIIYKALAKSNRIVKIRGLIPDRPGTLSIVTGKMGELGINIIDVFHERFNPEIKPNYVEVSFVIEVPPEAKALDNALTELGKLGYKFWTEHF